MLLPTTRILSRSAAAAPIQFAPRTVLQIPLRSTTIAGARGLHATPRAQSDVPPEGKGGQKRNYLQPELLPLYGIVALAVSAALYTLGGHFFGDNDIRRLPEHPEGHGVQKAPEFKPMNK